MPLDWRKIDGRIEEAKDSRPKEHQRVPGTSSPDRDPEVTTGRSSDEELDEW